MLEKFKYKLKYRRTAQIGSLVINNSYFLSFMKFCPTVGMNCYACPLAIGACPIGSLQHFMIIERIPFFLIGFFTMIGGVVGRAVCGWFCPIGWLQEIINKIPSPKLKINFKPLKYSKYIVLLVLVLIVPYLTKDPWFSKLCFIGTIEAGIPLALFDEEVRLMIGPFFFSKLGLAALLLTSFIFVKRGFCRFLCPLGAIYSLFNRFSFLHLRVDSRCTKCNHCQDVCPVEINVYENPNSTECIRCLECTSCAHVSLCAGKKKTKILKDKGVEIYA